jgi:hypothetical protein
MAKILTFQSGGMRREDSVAQAVQESAEVIVFPGVRYEHWDTGGTPQDHSSSGRQRLRDRNRDVLELAD